MDERKQLLCGDKFLYLYLVCGGRLGETVPNSRRLPLLLHLLVLSKQVVAIYGTPEFTLGTYQFYRYRNT